MRLLKLKRKAAAALTFSMLATSILPSQAFAASANDLRPSFYILDEDEGTSYYSEDEDTASPSDAEFATLSDAILDAAQSFNSSISVVNIGQDEENYPYLSAGEGRTKGDIALGDWDYEEQEYFISGTANFYQLEKDLLATRSNASESNAEYTDRIMVFRPENSEEFSGTVFVEIMNASSKVDVPNLWRQGYEYLMNNGHVYVGVTSKDVTVSALKNFNSSRYKDLKWTDNGIIWDILGQLGTELKNGESEILWGESADDVYLYGSSQSGWYVNTFANYFNLANWMIDDPDALETAADVAQEEGEHIYDGYFSLVGNMCSAPVNGSSSFAYYSRMYQPTKATDVPYIQMTGELDYQQSAVRTSANEPDNKYRHYVVAGGPHSDVIYPVDPLDEIQMKAGRDAGEYMADLSTTKDGRQLTHTDFNMGVFINAALENLRIWATDGDPAPRGTVADETPGTSSRDEFDNMDNGILSPQILIPVASYYGGVNGAYSDKHGTMAYLDADVIEDLYGSQDEYLDLYATALEILIEQGYILEEDYDTMMELAERQPIFGRLSIDQEDIEESMAAEVEKELLSSADKNGYTENEYLVSGKGYVYGVLTGDLIYKRRMNAFPYTNYTRVCVPDNFTGKVVIDLLMDGEDTKDVSSYMAEGIAYVGITAEPDAAEAKGGSWDICTGKGDTKQEYGFVWDIISQTVNDIQFELVSSDVDITEITLGVDRAESIIVYTYGRKFAAYDTYGVDELNNSGVEVVAPLSTREGDMPDAPEEDSYGHWEDSIQYQENGDDEPVIGATVKNILQVDGKYYKDSNGNGQLDDYENWNLDSEERAEDLVSRMTIDDLIGNMFNNSRGMGINQSDKDKVDATGLLDESENKKDTSIFGVTSTYGTTDTIKELKLRHFILRQNPEPEDMASWINQMNLVAESTSLGIPVLVTSNSRNENGKMTFGMNDASGVFSTWPGTMGLAAAAKGDIANGGDASLISDFAEIARSEWDASGLKKGYMYMVDTMTDPRWQRTYGTFGEDIDFIADAAERLVVGFQGGSDGVQPDGVALTIKHFPGGGARENGFDPHYAQGQWNVYQTEGSLQKYHLPGFQAAVENNVASIMPYYAKPAALKSEPQYDYEDNPLSMQAVGFAFNKEFIQTMLRDQMGHDGYVNSDSGIINNMAWGVEELDVPERAAYAINAGTDIIGDTNDIWSLKEAYRRSADDSYPEDTIPYGLSKEDVTVTKEALEQANVRLLKEMFDLGLFENPYRDPDHAKAVVDTQENWDAAYEAHQKSVVLLKNTDNVLPLTEEKLEGKSVYVEYFAQGDGAEQTAALRESLAAEYGLNLTTDYAAADYAILFVDPESGNYFSATQGYLELDICDGKIVCDVDSEGRPASTTHSETTLKNAGKIKTISDTVKANGGKVISNVNFTLAWMLGNVEPYSDALLAGFDTYATATMDVILGKCDPTGKMPITLPRNDDVIKVDANGVCISPNDIPGYAKDAYMPDSMKDENGKAYAYRDADGNYYELDFGLTYDAADDGDTNLPDDDDDDNSSSGSGSSSGGGSGSGGAVTSEDGHWVKDEIGWWFRFNDGTWPSDRWMYLYWNGSYDWYHFGSDGYMNIGWLEDGGNLYYLHPISDGTMGHMYVGWHEIDGKWYYFNTESDGTKGRLLVNTTTPDGYHVDANGVWIQ